MIVLLLVACQESTPWFHDGEVEAPFEKAFAATGAAPWDPFRISFDEEPVVSPVVFGAGGERAVTALADDVVSVSDGLFRVDVAAEDQVLVAAGYWAWPTNVGWGTGTTGVPHFWPHRVEWEVGAFGRAADFDPGSTLGRWLLDPAMDANVPEMLGIARSYLGPLHLELLDVTDGVAEFRLVATVYQSTDECVLLQDRATLSSTGELSWSMDRIEAVTDPDPIVLYRPRFRIGFDGSENAAGGEVEAIVDVRATAATGWDLCTFVDGGCLPCEDDGNFSCLPVAAFAWTAARVDEPIDDALPVCGADFTDTGTFPDWSFDLDCGDWSGTLCAGVGLLLFAPFARRRRA